MAADDEVIAEIHQALIPVEALGRLLATIERARIELELTPDGARFLRVLAANMDCILIAAKAYKLAVTTLAPTTE